MTRIATISLVILAIVCGTLTAACADMASIKLFVGKRPVPVSPAPVLINNKVMAPLGALGYLGLSYAGSSTGAKVSAMAAGGSPVEVPLQTVEDAQMFCVDDLLRTIGGQVVLSADRRSATVRADVKSVEFADGRLRVNCSVPVAFSIFTWSNKLVVDIPDARLATEAKEVFVGTEDVVRARLGEPTDGDARVVLDLARETGYRVESAVPAAEVVLAVGQGLDKPQGGRKPQVKPAVQPFTIDDLRIETVDEREFKLTITTSGKGNVVSTPSTDPAELTLTLKGGTLAETVTAIAGSSQYVKLARFAQVTKNPAVARVFLAFNRPMISSTDVGAETITVNVKLPDNAGGTLAGRLVVIDPGHGGQDKGANRNGINEKDLNLAIAAALERELKERGARTMITRGPEFISLESRPRVAVRNGADFFISVHCNSTLGDNRVSGIETYHSRSAVSAPILADDIRESICSITGMCDRRTHGRDLVVLKGLDGTGIPGVLIECGYINHSGDRAKLMSPEYRKKLSEAIVDGLKKYIEGK